MARTKERIREYQKMWARSWRLKNPERVLENSRRYRARHPKRDNVLRRRYLLSYYYGITVEQYDAMLASQDGGCAICAVADAGRKLCVDHDHETGSVRGLLCRQCNTALGQFKDEVSRVEKALEYLKKHKG